MSHTNSTTNYNLPQFITTDKPAWLTDVNNAYTAIDTAMKNNADAASAAASDASSAVSTAGSASTAAAAADAKASGAVASFADAFLDTSTYAVGERVTFNNLLYRCIVAVTVPGAWTGNTNWTRDTMEDAIDSLTAADIEYSAGLSVKNKIDTILGGFELKEYTFTMPSTVTNSIIPIETGVTECYFLSAKVWRASDTRYDLLPEFNGTNALNVAAAFTYVHASDGTLSARPYITDNSGVTLYGNATASCIFLIKKT